MNLQVLFKRVVDLLKKEKVRFALAGGLVASLYRKTQRLTNDLDFLILAGPRTQDKACSIVRAVGLKPTLVRKADLEGGPLFAIKRGRTRPYIVAGRAEGDPSKIGLDFILPEMPWFENALDRAEHNNVNFGFGPVPCLTVEDVLIAKFFSFKNDARRFNDLDDLKSIFEASHDLDLAYLSGQMQKLDLEVPPPVKALAPKVLNVISRGRR
ncbi:MAG: nucleotidyl transferase AbiEii/AbiGii toxin family protein [Deltaproteobacteria bacterium]|nr:nucleotidyl transferase AbiEii/AbiGii toxin family protein [Deltaproteobacteria bacterium]